MWVGRVSFGVTALPTEHTLGASVWTASDPLVIRGHEQTQIQLNPQSSGQKATHNIARLTEGLLLHGEERFAAQLGVAGHADEAVHVEDLVHGGAAGAFAHHILPTAGTTTCRQEAKDRWRDENHKKTKHWDTKHWAGRKPPVAAPEHDPAVQPLPLWHRRAAERGRFPHWQMLRWQLTASQTQPGQPRRALPRERCQETLLKTMWK